MIAPRTVSASTSIHSVRKKTNVGTRTKIILRLVFTENEIRLSYDGSEWAICTIYRGLNSWFLRHAWLHGVHITSGNGMILTS